MPEGDGKLESLIDGPQTHWRCWLSTQYFQPCLGLPYKLWWQQMLIINMAIVIFVAVTLLYQSVLYPQPIPALTSLIPQTVKLRRSLEVGLYLPALQIDKSRCWGQGLAWAWTSGNLSTGFCLVERVLGFATPSSGDKFMKLLRVVKKEHWFSQVFSKQELSLC